ncbi:MAG: septum formation initiator family protein [Bdellovibrionaceae bacterium]|nr:septum formation initiator family protein [Pseudobdellovibrionaceae bacterium]
MFIKTPFITVRNLLNSPVKVFLLSFVFFLVNFFGSGNFIKLLNLDNEVEKLNAMIVKNRVELEKTEKKITQAKDPIFFERQAREKFDLVSKDDLVFIFPSEQ